MMSVAKSAAKFCSLASTESRSVLSDNLVLHALEGFIGILLEKAKNIRLTGVLAKFLHNKFSAGQVICA